MTRKQAEFNLDPFQIDQDFLIEGFRFGQAVLVEEEEIMLEISEDGIDTSGNNFMLELFAIDDASGKEVLIPLKFKPTDEINRVSINEGFSEFFFDIEVDEQIPTAALCKSLKELDLLNKNLTLNKKVDCSQFDGVDARFNIYGSIKQEPGKLLAVINKIDVESTFNARSPKPFIDRIQVTENIDETNPSTNSSISIAIDSHVNDISLGDDELAILDNPYLLESLYVHFLLVKLSL